MTCFARISPALRASYRILVLAVPCLVGAAAEAAGTGDPPTGFHREWVWSVPGIRPGEGGLEIVDVNGDGQLEILFTADSAESYYDHRGRWQQWRLQGSFQQTWSSLAYPDELRLLRIGLPGPDPEIVIARSDRLDVHAGAGKELLRSISTTAVGATALEIADIDAQAGLEAVLCDTNALYVYDYSTGAEIAIKYGFGCSDLAIGQTDADLALEIALA
ncbi:MAG: Alkaline serine exoprotease precursor, partial [Acidobacteria bacterium]|nr:Alkaline serine exoprotease precursor [Acidobacteriota bacterium]